MFQHDYILRMIEMMGDLMRRVKELMDELSQMRLMDEACRRHCGLPMGALEALSAESLVELLAPTPRLFASELLYTRAEAFSLPAEQERDVRLKSLRLLISLWEEGPLCELRAGRVQALKQELLPLLTADDLMLCARFLFEGGAYADMEDAVFEAAAAAEPGERLRHIAGGEALLRRAAKAGEAALALARTSSGELRLSARELRERYTSTQAAQASRRTDKGESTS